MTSSPSSTGSASRTTPRPIRRCSRSSSRRRCAAPSRAGTRKICFSRTRRMRCISWSRPRSHLCGGLWFRRLLPGPPATQGGTHSMLQNIAGAAPAADGLVKDTTTQAFVKDVIEESKRQPVLVDFWAEWCGPCKQLTPVLEKAVRGAKGKVKLVKMDIDKHPAIPGQMGIQSIPAVIAFVNGQPADGFLGALPEAPVVAFLERLTAGMPGEPNVSEI